MNKYKSLSPLLVVILVFSSFAATVSSQEEQRDWAAPLTDEALLAQLKQAALGDLRVSYHRETGQVRFLGVHPGAPLDQPRALAAEATAQEAARAFLDVYAPLFGLQDQARELRVLRDEARDGGRNFTRFQQTYRGIPVLGGELIVQTNALRQVVSVNGEILPGLALDVTPGLSAASARQTALGKVAKDYGLDVSELQATEPELWIYDPLLLGGPGPRFSSLVWRIEVTPLALAPIRELVLVDAQLGAIALHFNQVDTARNRETYDAGNTETLPGTLVCGEANPTCSGGDAHEVAAHVFAGETYDFYAAEHGRDSIDDAGMTLISTVHYGSDFNNAFWNGSQMVYGDGADYPLADDVVAHELTHGITDHESSLFYFYQPGAINESLSDIWGEFVDLEQATSNDAGDTRWALGEDVESGGTGAIRNMQDPTLFGDPDRMSSSYYVCDQSDLYSGTGDNGGVHSNSGVNNKAAYLMTDGDTFNGQTVTGLGYAKVADLYYEVQTNLLTSAADYADLYDALLQACNDLGYSASDCQEVQDALNAVEMNQQPPGCPATEAPVCDSGEPVNLFFDDIESGSGNWTAGSIAGSAEYWFVPQTVETLGLPGPYSTSGVGNIWGFNQGDNHNPDFDTGGASDTYLAMNSDVSLPANAYMHFAHSYGFESEPDLSQYYDGGVLEYSANGGSSWNDAGALFEHNGYNGALSTSSDNPLGGRSAFGADSRGYISSRLDLSSLSGQNVRFRFRLGTDSDFYDYGWFIDDVRIYTCEIPNNAPTMSGLPDQTLTMNDSSDNAIDLWAFAADDESGDDELTFSIDNSPDPGAGVSIDSNRYVDITPTLGWTGQTDVVIRVSDPGGASATDTFSVLVQDKVWDGSTGSDWHTADNWTPSGVPTYTNDVLIPDVANDPVISNGDAAVGNLIIEPGAVLDLDTRQLTVEGALTNQGTLKQAQVIEVGVAANLLRITNRAVTETKYYGLDITATDAVSPTREAQATLVNVTASVSGNQFCAGRSSGVLRCYDVESASAMTATVRFYLTEAERNGQTLGDLVVWHYGLDWTEQPGPFSSGGSGDAQYVEAQNVADFSLFALDEATVQGGLVYMPLLSQRYPPIPDTPVLNSISNGDGDGSYSVSWNSAYLADSYTLQEDDNASFSSPTERYSGTATSWSASGKDVGTYYYRVRASNSWGDSAWSSVQSVTVAPPTRFYPVADVTVLEGSPNSNFGNASTILAGYFLSDCGVDGRISRSLIRFDLSEIPSGMAISEARLYLKLVDACYYVGHTQNRTVTLYRTTSSWLSSSATWVNKPDYAESCGSASVSIQAVGWHSFNVTNVVRQWINGSRANYGFTMRAPENSGSEFALLAFASSDASDADERPYLQITYSGMVAAKQAEPTLEESFPLDGSAFADSFGLGSIVLDYAPLERGGRR